MLMSVRHVSSVVVIAGFLSNTACGQSSAPSGFEPSVGQAGKDVIWVPTPQALVDRMLDMVELTPKDYLVDLGSGDGRTVITAAKRGAKAHGIEFNGDMVTLAKGAAMKEGVQKRATFAQADIFESDFSKATVVSLFLLPDLNVRLRPTLLKMKPGTRIVSNSFDMGDWQADQTAQVEEGCETYCTAYQWTVPAAVDGTWKMSDKSLALKQTYQMFEGTLSDKTDSASLQETRLSGSKISFKIGNDQYVGEVNGSTMKGTVNGGKAWRASRTR